MKNYSDECFSLISECEKAGNPDMVYEFASTSKVTFAGSGVAAVAASANNLEWMKKSMTIQTIGYDKINQLRHVKSFGNIEGMKKHMMKQAESLRPKFEAVLDTLERELGGLEIGSWHKPKGGYFIAFDSMEGCAKAIVEKCKEAGVVMTPAGSTYPYHKDPKDTNIRIAPSFPTPEDLQQGYNVKTALGTTNRTTKREEKRTVLPRKKDMIQTRYGALEVKKVYLDGKERVYVEYESAKKLAQT